MRKDTFTIPHELVSLYNNFSSHETKSDKQIRLILSDLKESEWNPIHTLLLETIISGNGITKQVQVYSEIGRIKNTVARNLANRIDDHIESLKLILKLIEEDEDMEALAATLSKQRNAASSLASEIRNSVYEQYLGLC